MSSKATVLLDFLKPPRGIITKNNMVLTTIFIIWATMSFCYCINEWVKPLSSTLWLIDVVFAPYFIIVDAIHAYKEYRNSAEQVNERQYQVKYLPPDNGEDCWTEGSETFTRKEVSDILHTQRAMISNDLKRSCGDNLTEKMYSILKNPRTPKF